LGSIAVGVGRVEGPFGVGVVQGGKELPFRDVHAFVKEHARNASGDFRCHRGAHAGCDVAAGVEQSLGFLAVGGARRRDFHHRIPRPQGEHSPAQHDEYSQGRRKNPEELSPRAPRT